MSIAADALFDVERAIEEFLADADCTSLELPHMTTGQRKHARRVAERHSELRCVSFGFGPERQLHILKGTCDAVAFDVDAGCKAASSGTAPSASLGRTCPDKPSKLNMPRLISSVSLEHQREPGTTELAGRLDAAPNRACFCRMVTELSPTCSTAAPHGGESPSSTPSVSSALSNQELPALPEGLIVRNTFIQVGGGLLDERAVRSMPHNMFGGCLLMEAARVRTESPRAAGGGGGGGGPAYGAPIRGRRRRRGGVEPPLGHRGPRHREVALARDGGRGRGTDQAPGFQWPERRGAVLG